jgi:hypothetical protein
VWPSSIYSVVAGQSTVDLSQAGSPPISGPQNSRLGERWSTGLRVQWAIAALRELVTGEHVDQRLGGALAFIAAGLQDGSQVSVAASGTASSKAT